MIRPLTDIKVLDVSRVLAGPYCGQLLADMGADVIKVEAPTGDENRKWAPLAQEQSCSFLGVNRGKRGITLNLQAPEGRALLDRLAGAADVLVHNFLPKTAQKLGIAPETLLTRHPRLIVCSISAYGAHGPMRDKPGYDGVVQAFSGIMGMTGEANGTPVRVGPSAVDMATGMLAFGAITTALIGRDRGCDRHVQVSLLETAISLLGFQAVGYLSAGKLPRREGSGLWNLVPYQAFRCADGYIMTGALNDGAWLRLCDVVERPDLRDDPTLAAAADRVERRAELVAIFEAIFATRSCAEWTERLEAAGVAVGPINTLDQVFAHPQTIANRMAVPAGRPGDPPLTLLGLAFKLGDDAEPAPLPPPKLGEHTDAALQDWLGLPAEELAALRTAGVV